MRGFTLIEVLISFLILTILMAGVFMVLNAANQSWYTESGIMDLQQEARRAIQGMSREIRQSRPSYVNVGVGADNVQFRVPSDITTDPLTYYGNITYSLNSNQIIREYPAGTTKVLANNIDSLSFSLSGNTVEVVLTASKNINGRQVSFPLTEKVRLRNE